MPTFVIRKLVKTWEFYIFELVKTWGFYIFELIKTWESYTFKLIKMLSNSFFRSTNDIIVNIENQLIHVLRSVGVQYISVGGYPYVKHPPPLHVPEMGE